MQNGSSKTGDSRLLKGDAKYKKVSVSFDKAKLVEAKKRAKELGFENSFSAYIQKLVESDLSHDQPAFPVKLRS